MLGPAHRASGVHLHIEQPHVTHTLQMRPDGVGVQPQQISNVGRGARRRRPGDLQINGVTGVVAECLEDFEALHGVTLPDMTSTLHGTHR